MEGSWVPIFRLRNSDTSNPPSPPSGTVGRLSAPTRRMEPATTLPPLRHPPLQDIEAITGLHDEPWELSLQPVSEFDLIYGTEEDIASQFSRQNGHRKLWKLVRSAITDKLHEWNERRDWPGDNRQTSLPASLRPSVLRHHSTLNINHQPPSAREHSESQGSFSHPRHRAMEEVPAPSSGCGDFLASELGSHGDNSIPLEQLPLTSGGSRGTSNVTIYSTSSQQTGPAVLPEGAGALPVSSERIARDPLTGFSRSSSNAQRNAANPSKGHDEWNILNNSPLNASRAMASKNTSCRCSLRNDEREVASVADQLMVCVTIQSLLSMVKYQS